MTFLTGHSGAGKSTFLRLLIGAESATRGRIYVDDVDISRLGARRMPWYRREVGVVFQDHNLLLEHSVFDNVALPLRINHLGEREVASRVRGALGTVELLGKEHLMPSQLSTGEQQRVGIARAVVGRPKILLADEPTGNLDPDLARSVMELFGRFNELGTTVLIASHDIALIQSLGMPTLNLAAGRIADVDGVLDGA
ncbi:MAG TPA: cell division ATP-binding protein FtsE [Gammaproteobacteria bacterium]|nr:cell division ATP-binding protein FtsE [Gammaproteobacteria bacterium]HBF62171.1 cell division ATP-binding protein FtsE [Gammaproteobacteria bacterium]HBK11842.1 cell division ATP-binding protein FtsE [Gammaproteobacteria bacterium]